MLRKLNISNYAIIENAEIDFSAGLNIITGETGAGKSILLGALGLLLGARADSKILFKNSGKCIIEGLFFLKGYELQLFFENADIDYSDETIIRRELNESGKSRAFINDTPVTLSVLQQLADNLIQIHSQHETLALADSKFQLMVIDSLASTNKLLPIYQKLFNTWKSSEQVLKEAIENAAKAERDKDYIEFQLKELTTAKLEDINQEELENTLQQLTHAEEIKRGVFETLQILQDAEFNAIDLMRDATSKLQSIRKFAPDLESSIQRLESNKLELQDIVSDLTQQADKISADPNTLATVQSVLDSLYHLQKKHNVSSVNELLEIQQNFQTQFLQIENASDNISALRKQVSQQFKDVVEQAKAISDSRKKQFTPFEKNVAQLLKEVGMQSAVLKVDLHFSAEQLNKTGGDSIQFTFSANPGSALQDIKKVASGGELSRLMLSIKSLIAKNTALPTLIFDEIDSGVSGDTAMKVGVILEKLSVNHQVIAITHLPQIAAKGKHHLKVFKQIEKNNTTTHLRLLNKEDRIQEIALMLSGENPSKAAFENAKELMGVD
ncbi:MAG: DNA repair protein RecN [Chitinophagales bacterium]|nr:DNA repair protein RecN [Chitinophagales bacterium]MBP9190789.1 DNA repair protein RecN [Chitinophagales bacterium]MBP9705591.1 DNA repair protein RecN [Chitinophagales bacterium]